MTRLILPLLAVFCFTLAGVGCKSSCGGCSNEAKCCGKCDGKAHSHDGKKCCGKCGKDKAADPK